MIRRLVFAMAGCVLGLAGLVAGWFALFAQMRLDPPATPFEFRVKPGANLRGVSVQLTDAGLLPEPYSLWLLARGLDKTSIHAGHYRVDKALTPLELLEKLNRGDVVLATIQFIEGTTFSDLRKVVAAHTEIKQTLTGLDGRAVLAKLGAEVVHPEGWFFPDTYRFSSGASDVEVLKRAHAAMRERLAAAWRQRDEGLPYRNPEEVLIMASIIEKETGRAAERALIASVFVNRLRIGMRLQTDPTVIYGLGERFDGNLRKRDLINDTAYNTYTRDGLPPTPIAMPGWASLLAAVQPERSDYLYFVGKGDGSHHFSKNLAEHNRAVAKYQLGQ